jgi:hypothetical protein
MEGPFLDHQILKMAKSGEISRSAKLKHPERTQDKWVQAADVPGIGKFVVQSSGKSNVSSGLPPEMELGSLDQNLPSWTAVAEVAPAATSENLDYWGRMTQGLASEVTKQSVTKEDSDIARNYTVPESKATEGGQGSGLFVAAGVFVLSFGVLLCAGFFVVGVFFFGESDEERQISERAKANRKEFKNGFERAVGAISGVPSSSTSSRGGGSGNSDSSGGGRSVASSTRSKTKTKRVEVQLGTVIITDHGYSEINQVRIECNNGNVLTSNWRRNPANQFGYDLEEPTVTETTNRMAVILAIRGAIANYLNGKYD